STATLYSTIEGSGGGQGIYSTTCLRGFRILGGGRNAYKFTYSNISVRNTCLDAAGGVTSTASGFLALGAMNHIQISGTQINSICKAINISGNGATPNKGALIDNNLIIPSNDSACIAISFGVSGTGGGEGDISILNNRINCS